MDKVTQAIIIRKKYPDGKGGSFSLRRGKEIAQACHASGLWMAEKLVSERPELSLEETLWCQEKFTKIVFQVDGEEELLKVYEDAKSQGLNAVLITDSGATEFNGVPTNTAVGIGPHWKSKIDPVTKDLKLY